MSKFITVGVAGHVDHGKTSLVKALTGIDTDRLQEEKRRGLSIESGIAPFELPSGGIVALVDVPGHTDYLKNTIRGLSCIDAAILVIASDDGVMPQTAEHLRILELMGVNREFAVLSKTDLVDEETLELAELEVRELTEGTFLHEQPIVLFSAVDQRCLAEIRKCIQKQMEAAQGKDPGARFRLWMDQIKMMPGFGTVVSGTILSGHQKEGDGLVFLPLGKETRVRSIETHHERVLEAFAGQRVGISLHRVPLQEIEQGMLLAEPEAIIPSNRLNVDIKVLPGARKPLKNKQRVKLYLGTSVTNACVVLVGTEFLAPGDRGLAQFWPMKPVPAMPSDAFAIGLLDVPAVIGGGAVLETG